MYQRKLQDKKLEKRTKEELCKRGNLEQHEQALERFPIIPFIRMNNQDKTPGNAGQVLFQYARSNVLKLKNHQMISGRDYLRRVR